MNVVMVGTGNVAVVLSQLVIAAGHTILEVHGKNPVGLSYFSNTLHVKTNKNFSSIQKNTDICIIAISDNAIKEVAAKFENTETLIVHTSGATSKNVLNRFANYGVLYPLQSLRKEMTQLPEIPFFTDANTLLNLEKLFRFAATLSNQVSNAGDEQRLQLHLAAVLCSNFTNHLYAVTQDFCRKEQIDFTALLPLIKETSNRLQYFSASQMQTGPAIRRDTNTIDRHLEVLQHYPQISKLYALLTESIQQFSGK